MRRVLPHSLQTTAAVRGGEVSETPSPWATGRGVDRNADDTFRTMMQQHAPYVWRVLRSLGVVEADLPDICQETFLIVYRKLPDFEGRSSLRTWICGIAIRVASDYRSRAYRRREQVRDTLPEVASEPSQPGAVERREAWRRVGQLLDALGEDQRQVFVLYEIEQLSMKEVAAALDCPLSTAYSRLHAARATVRKTLAIQRQQEGHP